MSMIYKEGTASLTKGSPVLKGKDTYFLNPIFNVGVGQIVQVKTGDNVYVNSIKEVVDNETLILSFDSISDVKDGEIVIMITMVDSISDTANKLLGMTRGLVQFETEMTKWFTSMDKKITITLPDGTKKEVYSLQAIMEQVAQNEKEMQELLQNSEKKVNDMVDKAQTDVNNAVTDGTNKINQAVDKADKEINESITSGTGKIDTMLTESQEKIDKTIEDTEVKVDTELGKIDEKIGDRIDGMVNKAGDIMTGSLITKGYLKSDGGEVNASDGNTSISMVVQDGVPQIVTNYGGSGYIRNTLPDHSGKLLSEGDYGIGSSALNSDKVNSPTSKDANNINRSGFYAGDGVGANNFLDAYMPIISASRNGGADGTGSILQIQATTDFNTVDFGFRRRSNNIWNGWQLLANKTTLNEQLFMGAVSSKYITSVDGDNKLGMRAREASNVILNSRKSQTNEIKIPEKSGTMMLVGDYGFGTRAVFDGDNLFLNGVSDWTGLRLIKNSGSTALIQTDDQPENILNIDYLDNKNTRLARVTVPRKNGTVLLSGDYGIGDTNRLYSNNLDDVRIAGEYQQDITGNATTERNYPIKEAGSLKVTQTVGGWGVGGVIQEYTTYSSAKKFIRVRESAKWNPWEEEPNRHTSETQRFNGQLMSYQGLFSSDKSNPTNYFGLLKAEKGIPYGFYLSYDGSGSSIRFPERKGGTLMLVKDYGIGSDHPLVHSKLTDFINPIYSGFRGYSSDSQNKPTVGPMGEFGSAVTCFYNPKTYAHLITPNYGDSYLLVSRGTVGGTAQSVQVMTSNMWTVDPQGFIKKASPIIDIYPDGTFTTNDESEGATVTRVSQGEYLIEGVLGFNSDAGWGGVDGGIEIPLDVNKQPLIWVDSKVMEDGSILVKTYHRTHLNAPKFARNEIEGFNDGDPIDIPSGRFVSVRVNMPEGSIFNQMMNKIEQEDKEMESNPFYKEERAFPNIIFNKKGDL